LPHEILIRELGVDYSLILFSMLNSLFL
jgi:hypothetical protein